MGQLRYLENKIVQWNVGGLSADKRNELRIIVQEVDPFVICVQETFFNDNSYTNFPGFQTVIRNSRNLSNLPKRGGVMIMIKNNFSFKKINLQTNLQATAIEVYYPMKYIICNIYCPPGKNPTKKDLENIAEQLGDEHIIVGDFNGHNQLWGSRKMDRTGKEIEDFLAKSEAILLNTGENTHFSIAHQSFTAIDLSMATPNLATMIEWSVDQDLRLSDHFPIILEFPKNQKFSDPPKWKIDQADWEKFFISCNFETQSIMQNLDINKLEESIRKSIVEAGKISIPKTSGKIQKKCVPWWDLEISNLIKEKRKLMRNYRISGNVKILADYIRKRNTIKRKIKEKKKEILGKVCF